MSPVVGLSFPARLPLKRRAGRDTLASSIYRSSGGRRRISAQFEICESVRRLGSSERNMGEYSDRVRAEIVRDNVTRRILYVIFAVITVVAVFTLGGFAILVAVVGLGPVLVLIVVVEIYCRILNWRHLRVAEDADADLDKLRPEKSTEPLPADVIDKLRKRANQAQGAGEPYLAADLRLAVATLERLNHDT
jgi:hypothetical protein